MSSISSHIRRALPYAAPIMAGYVAIGIPCGILEAEVGIAPWMAFVFSATFYSGAGQFMLSNLWLAGQPLLAIAASISFVNLRQLLYSAAFAPRFQKVKRWLAALFALTVTDESFGVNLDRFAQSEERAVCPGDPEARPWDAADATCVNLLSMSAWATANFVGGLVGSALAIPTAVASFAMTAIFICLLFGRSFTSTTIVVGVVSAAMVVLMKAVGLEQPAIIVGAVCGVAAGCAFAALTHDQPIVPETPGEAVADDAAYAAHLMDAERLEAAEDAMGEVDDELR